ncbi:MAG: argininosuccinate synthase [Candidatus Daviesbacteria bacterium]|nr:argininosuccinate synthase [Candidatus Daviesbacteria bacterium]
MNKVVLAFSGGLDTSYCALYLKEQGYDVVTVTVDTGGFSKVEIDKIAAQSKLLGAKNHYLINGKSQLYNQFISYIIKGNILRGGVYPLCAGTERLVIVQKLVETAKKVGAEYIAHGSTGAGNDQIRFDVALQVLAPDLKILTPVRDSGIKREEEFELLKKYHLLGSFTSSAYSINQSLLGVTVSGEETKGSWDTFPEEVIFSVTPLNKTPQSLVEFVLSFKKGLPVAIDNKKMSGIVIMDYLGKIGSQHGIGTGIHLGNTILGIKGRVAFAAPAAIILIKAHKELEKLVQTKWQSFWKETLSDFYGNLLHEALYFDPVMRDLEAMIDSSQQNVTGDVKVQLFKGNIIINGCQSPYSLMDPKIATYGEENIMWDSRDIAGFSKIYAIPGMLATNVKRKKKI